MTLPASKPHYFHSDDTGAPSMTSTAGSQLEVLRACLVNGYNARPVTSIIVAAEVATATAANHGYSTTPGKLLLVEGAPVAALNGRKQPLAVTTNTFTFPAPGVPDGTYTGTMSAKRAPLGWTEAHTGTDVAIFARSAMESTAPMLWVNDSHAGGSTVNDARWQMVESATDVDTLGAVSPAGVPGGFFVAKGQSTAAPKDWVLVGTDRFMWFFPSLGSWADSVGRYAVATFGDFPSVYAPDPWACLISGQLSGAGNVSSPSPDFRMPFQRQTNFSTWTNAYPVAARARSGSGAAVRLALIGPGSGDIGSSGPTALERVPIVYPLPLAEDDTAGGNPVRGFAPGLAAPLAALSYANRQIVSASSGRTFLAIRTRSNASSQGCLLIDLDGPWQ